MVVKAYSKDKAVMRKLLKLQSTIGEGIITEDKHGVPRLTVRGQGSVVYFADSQKYRLMSHEDFKDPEILKEKIKK